MPIPLPALPEGNATICLVIPNSAQWRQIYMGALVLLQQWWYYDTVSAEDAEDVIQRVMECHYLTSENYEGCMTIDCSDIIACINNPESGVIQSIIDKIQLQTAEQYRQNSQNQAGLILGSGVNPSCDPDVLWGGIRSVIDLADDNNIDVLQILEVVTNPVEFVQEVVLGIFGVELPIIQSIVDWVSWVQDNILENYEAQITTTYLNEIKCDLFCLTRDSCQLTPETLTNYFYDRLGSELTIGSLLDETIAFLIGGVWTGTQIADVFFLSQFAFRAQLGKWFRLIGFLSVDTDFRIGANTPDNDWEILCTECPSTWTSTLDFTVSDYGFVFTVDSGNTLGEWVDGVGLRSIYYPASNYNWLNGYIDFDATVITSIATTGTMTRGFYSDTGLVAASHFVSSDPGIDPNDPIPGSYDAKDASEFPLSTPTPFVLSSTLFAGIGESYQLSVRPKSGAMSGTGSCTIVQLVITGEGDKPPQLP